MSTGLIVAIVVVALLLIGLLVMLPRMRAGAERKKAERELQGRRDRVAGEHRDVAQSRERDAERAEQQARIAQQEAEKQRSEARLQQERATLHERGMADDELIDDHERDRFAGVAGTQDSDGDGSTRDDRARAATGRDGGATTDDRAGATAARTDAASDYQQGRIDERRDEESAGDKRFEREEARTRGEDRVR
jgi:hypothetical protein